MALSRRSIRALGKIKSKEFSERNWLDVCKRLKIIEPCTGNIFNSSSTVQLDQDNLKSSVDGVLNTWSRRSKIWRFPGYNENELMIFICDIIYYVFPINENLAILSDSEAIDLKVCAKNYSHAPVVYIVEAKKGDIDQGRAQLYLQLKICYEIAKQEEKWEFPIYGVISTGMIWIFIKYDGNHWVESNPILVSDVGDSENIKKVVEMFYKIIHLQNDRVGLTL
jgi:hypothetical protein